jgi:hypothetical protein
VGYDFGAGLMVKPSVVEGVGRATAQLAGRCAPLQWGSQEARYQNKARAQPLPGERMSRSQYRQLALQLVGDTLEMWAVLTAVCPV